MQGIHCGTFTVCQHFCEFPMIMTAVTITLYSHWHKDSASIYYSCLRLDFFNPVSFNLLAMYTSCCILMFSSCSSRLWASSDFFICCLSLIISASLLASSSSFRMHKVSSAAVWHCNIVAWLHAYEWKCKQNFDICYGWLWTIC